MAEKTRNLEWRQRSKEYPESDSIDVAGDVLAIPVTHPMVNKTTADDAEPLTLANGEPGQILCINLVTDGGGDGTLTPVTSTNWATIVFADAGDEAILFYANDTIGWKILSVFGLTAQPTVTV